MRQDQNPDGGDYLCFENGSMVGAGYTSVVVAKTVGVQKKGSASSVKPLYWQLTGCNQPQSIRVVVVANTGVHRLAFII